MERVRTSPRLGSTQLTVTETLSSEPSSVWPGCSVKAKTLATWPLASRITAVGGPGRRGGVLPGRRGGGVGGASADFVFRTNGAENVPSASLMAPNDCGITVSV